MKLRVTDYTIQGHPTNARWEGFGKLEPVCKCGSRMAQRFDDKPWRCIHGHYSKPPGR